MAPALHMVFMNYEATGHINPTLPVVAELVARGCKVTYFVHEAVRAVVEAAGADWRPFRYPDGGQNTGILDGLDEAGVAELVPEGTLADELGKLPGASVYAARQVLPALLEDLGALVPPPVAIVYDIFVAAAPVAAKVLGVPAIGFVPHPGPGVVSDLCNSMLALEAMPWVDRPRRDIEARYGVDVLEAGLLLEFYSSDLNIVSTIDEFFATPTSAVQKQRIGHCPFRCVGALVDGKVKRVANSNVGRADEADGRSSEAAAHMPHSLEAELPMEQIEEALAAGRRLLYISLGTVTSGPLLWRHPLGAYADGNDGGRQEGARALSAYTGKEFCQHIWRTCFEALGDDEGVLVVMTVGPPEDALEGLPPAPANFVLRRAVPQIELLPKCGAMLTHGGANSMHEGLAYGVPMAVVPVFGDQPTNADSVARVGAGVSFRDPLRTATAAALRSALHKLLDPDAANPYRTAARAMSGTLKAAGGVPGACDAIMERAIGARAQTGGA